MKKFLAVLLSAVLCAAVAYSACAEEAASAEDNAATVTDTSKSVEEIVDALKNDEKAQALAQDIANAIKTGEAKNDVKDLLSSLGSYVEKAGFDVSDLKDNGAVRDVLDMFLADAGVDSEELNNAISQSTIANGILDLYYSAPVEPEDPDPEVVVPEEEPVIPDTDFVG